MAAATAAVAIVVAAVTMAVVAATAAIAGKPSEFRVPGFEFRVRSLYSPRLELRKDREAIRGLFAIYAAAEATRNSKPGTLNQNLPEKTLPSA